MVRLRCADCGHASGAGEPVFRQLSEGAVPEPHEGLAASRCGEERGQIGADAAEVDVAVQLEPVDTGADVEPHRACPSIEPPIRFDAPAFRDQHRDEGRQQTLCKIELDAASVPVGYPAHAECLEARERGALGRRVAPPGQAPLTVEVHRLHRPRIDVAVAVCERHSCVEAGAGQGETAVVSGPCDADARLRRFDASVDAQLVGALEARRIRGDERLEERCCLLRRHRHRPDVQEPGHPPIGAAGVECSQACGAVRSCRTPQYQRCGDEQGFGQRVRAPVATDDTANRVARLRVPRDLQLKLGWLRIPHDGDELSRRHIRSAGEILHQQPVCLAQALREIALQRRVQHERRGHRPAGAISTPRRTGVLVGLGCAADRFEDAAVALVGQTRDVVAADRERLGLRPGAGLLSVTRQELDEQPARCGRTHEVDHVDQVAGRHRAWRDGFGRWSDLRKESLPGRGRRRTSRRSGSRPPLRPVQLHPLGNGAPLIDRQVCDDPAGRAIRDIERTVLVQVFGSVHFPGLDELVVEVEGQVGGYRKRARTVGSEYCRPDVLARLDRLLEERTGAVDDQPIVIERQRDVVKARAAHRGVEDTRARRHS